MRFYFYKDLNINKNDRLVTVSLWGIMSTVHNEAISSLCTGTIRENNYIRFVLCLFTGDQTQLNRRMLFHQTSFTLWTPHT